MDSNDTANDVNSSVSATESQSSDKDNIIDHLVDTALQPKNLYALAATVAIPLLTAGKKFAARHPVVLAGFLGTAAIGYFLSRGRTPVDSRTLH